MAFVLGCGPSSDTSDGGTDAATDTSAEAVADGGDAGPTPAEIAAFNQLVTATQNELTKSNTPGASIAVVLHGKLTFAAGVGNKLLSPPAAVTTSTRFRAASMSKMIVAATAMSLVDAGMLDLAAPITNYIPWFSLASGYDASTLTTSLLISHSSGFPCDTIGICDSQTSGDREAFFVGYPQPLWAPPGAVYDYSNTGFALAAAVLEGAAGTAEGSYEELASERVFVPAGMTTASYDATAVQSGDYATGYTLDATNAVTGTVEPLTLECPMLHPYGGVMATATDYAHFAEMLLASGASTLTPASAALMQTGHADMHTFATQEYAYGLIHQFSPYSDHASVWHDGSLPGYTSEMWMIPDDGFAVVVLTNARGVNYDVPDDIVADALPLFISETEHVPPLTTPPSAWSGYVGTYDDTLATLGTGVVVSLDGGTNQLAVAAPNSLDLSFNPAPVYGAMTQYAVDEWGMPDGTVATFFPAANADGGPSTYLVTRRGVASR
jgi:CubicO group peptidase (beta-lactamase class C family)